VPEQNIEVSTQQVIFSFTVVLIAVTTLVAFFFAVIISYFRANARRQSELLKAMIETQEKERNRIAIDMHDELGPLLSAVKLRVGGLRNSVKESSAEVLSDTQQMLDEAIQQIRQIIRDLVPKNIDQKGLAGVLQDLKTYVETFTPIKVELEIQRLNERFSVPSEINIYRIVHEILNNSIKHSGAEKIKIQLVSENDHLNLLVDDNGKGFDPQKSSDGSGLKNIETRVKMSQGEYRLETSAQGGTRYFITFEKKYLQ